MSIWSRLADALTALVDGEPLSAVFGKLRSPPESSIAFTIAVIALGAKMAKADGLVTRDEIAAFRQIFHIPADQERNAARVFDRARIEIAGYEAYAQQVARMFQTRPAILEDLLEGLVFIAMADGRWHPGEAAFLDRVRTIFGIDDGTYASIRARHKADIEDPYVILGLSPNASDAEIRARWRDLARTLHPDSLIARGTPEEARKLAEQRLATVNRAYHDIRAARKATAS